MTKESITTLDEVINDRYVPQATGGPNGEWGTYDRLEKRFVCVEELKTIGIERLKHEQLPQN